MLSLAPGSSHYNGPFQRTGPCSASTHRPSPLITSPPRPSNQECSSLAAQPSKSKLHKTPRSIIRSYTAARSDNPPTASAHRRSYCGSLVTGCPRPNLPFARRPTRLAKPASPASQQRCDCCHYSHNKSLWNPTNYSIRRPCTGKERSVETALGHTHEIYNAKSDENESYIQSESDINMAAQVDNSASFARDVERGPDAIDPRMSSASMGDGIGSAISSSNSSIMGEDVQADLGDEWGPQHPCYPHMNPHVPVDSMEYATTRIIRVRRDWLLHGDLAPTFSNLYPEILDPAGVSEPEFRRVIEKLNGELTAIFNPYSARNILDSVLGAATGWLWDDIGMAASKSRLNNLEKWINKWNVEMEKTIAPEEGILSPKIIPLRQTGYMTVSPQCELAFHHVPTLTSSSWTSRYQTQRLLLHPALPGLAILALYFQWNLRLAGPRRRHTVSCHLH